MALIDKAAPDASPADGYNDATDRATAAAPIAAEKIAQMQTQLREKIPPESRDAFERTVTAGMKFLYSDQAKPMVAKALDEPGPVDKKLAANAAGLILLLDKESRNTIPQQILVPAAAFLLLEAADLAVKTGRPITERDVRDGLDQMTALVMMKFGANKDQIMQAIAGGAPPGGPAQPPAAPAMPA